MYSSLLQKIPIVLVGLILVIAFLKIYSRAKNVTKSEFVKILKNAKYLQIGALIVVIILTGVLAS